MTTKKKHPGGAPHKTIDWGQMDLLCSIGCNQDEVAEHFKLDWSTIGAIVKREKGMTFNEYRQPKLGGGRLALRKTLWDAAIKGHRGKGPDLQTAWKLAKQPEILNMKETFEQKIEHTGNITAKGYTEEERLAIVSDPDALDLALRIADKLVIPPGGRNEDQESNS